MGNSIHFSNFTIKKNSFTCKVKSTKREKEDLLKFSLSSEVSYLDRDAIACTLATLCGSGYDEIIMDLPVSEDCCAELKQFTHADVKVIPIKKHFSLSKFLQDRKSAKKDSKYILNFSGGYDSLAARALLPDDKYELVSVDFGGWFAREAEFFEKFNPNTLTTNFRQLKYDRESWTFMGTGTLLYARHLNAKNIIFGTILEASVSHFKAPDSRPSGIRIQPFSTMGLNSVMLMNGLTEVATAMIMTKYYPEMVGASLISLAGPTSEKRYRKQILTEIICDRYGRELNLPECPMPDSKQIQPFGRNLALDFLALYQLRHRGMETVSRTVSDIPDEAVEIATSLSLDFYEHLYPKYLNTIPEDIRDCYLSRLEECGIIPYTDKDWKEFEIVRQYLSGFHPDILR